MVDWTRLNIMYVCIYIYVCVCSRYKPNHKGITKANTANMINTYIIYIYIVYMY